MDETIIDAVTVPEIPANAQTIGKPVALLTDAPETPPTKKTGRPAGRKTRWDAPSMVAKRLKAAEEAAAKGEARPDTDIFGTASGFTDEPEETENTGETPKSDFFTRDDQPGAGHNGEQATPVNPEVHRPVAEMIWDSIILMLSMFIGAFWQPRKVGSNMQNNEIPFDERKMVIDAFCEYLASLGMIVLSPVQKLWLAIGAYAMPRLFLTINVLKEKFFKRKQPAQQPANPVNDPRFPQNPKPASNKQPEVKPQETAKEATSVTLDDVSKLPMQ
jgi:hypothetical protein